jgi:hypothetical protein
VTGVFRRGDTTATVSPNFSELCVCLGLLNLSGYCQNITIVGWFDRLFYKMNTPAAFPGKLVFVAPLVSCVSGPNQTHRPLQRTLNNQNGTPIWHACMCTSDVFAICLSGVTSRPCFAAYNTWCTEHRMAQHIQINATKLCTIVGDEPALAPNSLE